MWCCLPEQKCINHKCKNPAEDITREDWTSMAQEIEPDTPKI